MSGASLEIVCIETGGDGWECRVDTGSTSHAVTVSNAELQKYAAGSSDPAALVTGSFLFLLDREPASSILSRFSLSVIERYFPEYPSEIARYLR